MPSRPPCPRSLHPKVPLPKHWKKHVKSAILHVISLAQYATAYTRSWAADSRNARVRLTAEKDRLEQELALLREEIRIKDARMARLPAHRRPQYTPVERMAILELKAARAWSLTQTAEAFLVTAETIASWTKRVDEAGTDALVQITEPVNKFPDFVRAIVQRLKTLCPAMGKVKIAETLARAGLHLGVTTVGRILKEKPQPTPEQTAGDEATDQTDSTVVGPDGQRHETRGHRQVPESRLARGPDDRVDPGRLLDFLAAVRAAPVLAVLLVGRGGARPLLAAHDGIRRIRPATHERAGPCAAWQDDPLGWSCAEVPDL